MTEEAVKSWEFSSRCQMVASYLWNGKSVSLNKEQLAEYGVTVHQVITELAYWLKAEESEACWEAQVLYQGSRRRKTWIVYCTKQGDKYVFKAKVKAWMVTVIYSPGQPGVYIALIMPDTNPYRAWFRVLRPPAADFR